MACKASRLLFGTLNNAFEFADVVCIQSKIVFTMLSAGVKLDLATCVDYHRSCRFKFVCKNWAYVG